MKQTEAKVSLLDIDFDIDAYLATGEVLHNLALIPSVIERIRIERCISTPGPEVGARVARVAEFLTRVGGQGPATRTIGESIPETSLRLI